MAQKALAYLKQHNLVFKDMKDELELEYPTQDISKSPPVFANQSTGLSKKARKLLAAENRIAYLRSPDLLVAAMLEEKLGIHGACKAYIIKTEPPCTAFVVFDTPKYCADALAAKTMGANLPRHKRVDFELFEGFGEESLKLYLNGIDIKNVIYPEEPGMITIEFLTALGAAKAIVKSKTDSWQGRWIVCDYTPSVKPLEADEHSFDGVSVKTDDTKDIHAIQECIGINKEAKLKYSDSGVVFAPTVQLLSESFTYEPVSMGDLNQDFGSVSLADLKQELDIEQPTLAVFHPIEECEEDAHQDSLPDRFTQQLDPAVSLSDFRNME